MLKLIKSPAYAGLFLSLCFLTGCQPSNTPETISKRFWQALVSDDLQSARELATPESKVLIQPLDKQWQNAEISLGEIIIKQNQASVQTTLIPSNTPQKTLTTYLTRIEDSWVVDYQRTHSNPLQSLIKGLEQFGNRIVDSIEKELPQLEQGFKSFSEHLNRELQALGRELKKPAPDKPPRSHPGSI